jgi:hypothetical protein
MGRFRYLALLIIISTLIWGAFAGIRAIRNRKLKLPLLHESALVGGQAVTQGLLLAVICITSLAGLIWLLLG